jgi:hypothetical protein
MAWNGMGISMVIHDNVSSALNTAIYEARLDSQAEPW